MKFHSLVLCVVTISSGGLVKSRKTGLRSTGKRVRFSNIQEFEMCRSRRWKNLTFCTWKGQSMDRCILLTWDCEQLPKLGRATTRYKKLSSRLLRSVYPWETSHTRVGTTRTQRHVQITPKSVWWTTTGGRFEIVLNYITVYWQDINRKNPHRNIKYKTNVIPTITTKVLLLSILYKRSTWPKVFLKTRLKWMMVH